MGKTNYDEMMKRWLTNQVSEDERVKIEAWLDSIKKEDADDLEMTDEEAELLYQKIKSKDDNLKDIQSFKPESIRRKNKTKWTLGIAAGLLLFVLAGYAILELSNKEVFYASSDNGIKKITLNDGSLVWVHGESKLSYHETVDGRFAELTGEALFEVTKDSARPFVISYKDVSVRVVGTSFSLKTGDSIELMVLTGKVKLSSTTNNESVDVIPNEKAVYTSDGVKKYSLSKQEVTTAVANTEYDMNFSNATFAYVVDRLEKKFDVKVTLAVSEIEKCHVNLDITDHSLESSLQMITSVLNVEYQVNGGNITFTGSGCK
jgi:ferric-dicitrate binding protein FerR (iron transport regulator)